MQVKWTELRGGTLTWFASNTFWPWCQIRLRKALKSVLHDSDCMITIIIRNRTSRLCCFCYKTNFAKYCMIKYDWRVPFSLAANTLAIVS